MTDTNAQNNMTIEAANQEENLENTTAKQPEKN